jgi:Methyltransferase FkbM domain
VLPKAVYPVGTIPQDWPGLGDPQLSKSNSEPWELRSIEQAIEDLGHGQKSKALSVLKVDTEGSEWDAFAAMLASEGMVRSIAAGKIKQLLVEWHWDPDSRAKNGRHDGILRRLEVLGFKPWHISRHEGSDCCLDVSYIWQKQ